jgi:hypothetical protein
MSEIVVAIVGIALIGVVLLDAFETIVLPRQVTGRWRLTRLFYLVTWLPYARVASAFSAKRRERFLSFFGPLSLLLLLTLWAVLLVFGFALLHFADHTVDGQSTLARLWISL